MDRLKHMVRSLSVTQRRELLSFMLDIIAAEHQGRALSSQGDPVIVGAEYVRTMNGLLGINILEEDRHREFLWGRNCVIWKMVADGFTEKQIREVIPLSHSTICHSRAKMRDAFCFPNSFPFAIELYNKFTSLI